MAIGIGSMNSKSNLCIIVLIMPCVSHIEMAFKIFLNDISFSIGGSIINDDGEKWESCLLHTETIHCFLDVTSLIICLAKYADLISGGWK